MKKILILLLLLTSISTLSCGSGGAGPANVPPGENPGIASVIRLQAAQYIAQVNASIYLRAKVLDGNGLAVPNKTVTFSKNSSSIGTLCSPSPLTAYGSGSSASFTAVTDSDGIASARLDSGLEGFITVQAAIVSGASQIFSKNTVYFSPESLTYPTPVPPTLSLSAVISGNDMKITATVLDGYGAPVSNNKVTFGSDSTSVTFPQGNTMSTDGNGQAIITAKINASTISPFETQVNITASAANGAANMMTLFLNPVAIDYAKSSVTANPSEIALNGTSTIKAVVLLNTGAPAPDATTVNFTATCGTVTPFAQTTAGVATATFTAPSTPVTCKVSATVGGTKIYQTADVTSTTTLTVSPASQTITDSGTAQFTIAGGAAPYTITTSDTSLKPSTSTVASSGGTFTINIPYGTTAKTATYTIIDSAGAVVTATLTVTVTPVTPVPVTALAISPAVVTVNAGSITKFAIIGGTQPYNTTSTDPNNAYDSAPGDGVWSGSSVTVTVPSGAPAGLVTLNVFDSAGATVSAKLNILGAVSTVMTVNPSTMTLTGLSSTLDTATFVIAGGTPPYSVYSSNLVVIPQPSFDVSGTKFTINPNPVAVDTIVTLTVMDNSGATKTVPVTVTPATASLGVNPSTVSMMSGGILQFNIFGGTGGPLQIVSGNAIATIANAACTASGTGVLNCPAGTTSFTATAGIPLVPGVIAIITVIDINGNVSAISTVTVN